MHTIGMRSIFDGPEVSVYEMRGGTHVILMRKDEGGSGARPAIDHEVFSVREPGGNVITFFSSHASGKPT